MGLQHAQKVIVTYLNKYNMQSYTVPVKNLFFIQNYFWLVFNTAFVAAPPNRCFWDDGNVPKYLY